jgi:ABC-type glycerol-3-phosphate transport system substrate-binding protein
VDLVFTQLRESEWEENAVLSLIEEYERLNPAVSIRLQARGYGELLTDTTGSDLIVMEGRYLAEFIGAGTFSPLDASLQSDMAFGEWVIPLVSSMDVLFYNIDILKATGFDRPPKNRTEFLR